MRPVGAFGNISLHGEIVRKCLAVRHLDDDEGNVQGSMLFTDARSLAVALSEASPPCSRSAVDLCERPVVVTGICAASSPPARTILPVRPEATVVGLYDSVPGFDGDPGEFKIGTLSLGFALADVRSLVFAAARTATLETFLDTCDAQTRAWFDGQPRTTSCDSNSNLLCFTDGSFSPSQPGRDPVMSRAVAVFSRRGVTDEIRCEGILSDIVPDWLCEDDAPANAIVAECAALTFAALLMTSNFPGQHTCFVSDCLEALSCASGDCSTPNGLPQACVRNANFLRKTSRNGALDFRHVKSHEGAYANEVVDSAAKLAAWVFHLAPACGQTCNIGLKEAVTSSGVPGSARRSLPAKLLRRPPRRRYVPRWPFP